MKGAVARLNDLPRARFTFLPTPLVELRRLSAMLKGPRLLMKRDDLTGLGLGGNKTRKLEFLLGEALEQGCDSVITGGAMQSNHCRQTAAAAASVGLECHLALGGEEPEIRNGNLLLDRLFGAIVHWCGDERRGEQIPHIAAELHSRGKKPYVVPYGGSNVVGAMGFVAAVGEVKAQLDEHKIAIDHLIVASSSGGTHAGMAVGLDVFGLAAHITGIGIDKGQWGDVAYESQLADLANQTAERLGIGAIYSADEFRVRRDYLGRGYGVMGDLEQEAIALFAEQEAILLDPVYTGRTMGGFIDMVRNAELGPDDTVLLWHTGGVPAIFSYAKELNAAV